MQILPPQIEVFVYTNGGQTVSSHFNLFHRKVFSSFSLILVTNKPTNKSRQAYRQTNMRLWQG